MHFKFLKNIYCPCPAEPVSLNFDLEKKSFTEKTVPVTKIEKSPPIT